ncbi:MAG: lipoyl(octanoyl) transferase LipB [Deltaproteobacteria bacterium]|nr:lipoyl(octanoyl) transferase LipB [Deltaproteobacteria bacterium]
MASSSLEVLDLEVKDYQEVWQLQKELVAHRIENKIPDTLLLVEHPHVITKGRRSKASDVVNPKVPVFEVERGGEVTYHGPGQLVCYPIFYLGHHAGVKQYMRSLEEVVIQTLEHFDIRGERKEGCTGVWVENKKIASLGVAVKKWVTYHGLALNVNTDLSYFQMINPCGLDCSVMTSMQAQRCLPPQRRRWQAPLSFPMEEVKVEVVRQFELALL